jgi:hypothetical protein
MRSNSRPIQKPQSQCFTFAPDAQEGHCAATPDAYCLPCPDDRNAVSEAASRIRSWQDSDDREGQLLFLYMTKDNKGSRSEVGENGQ